MKKIFFFSLFFYSLISYSLYDVKWVNVVGCNYNPSTNLLTKTAYNNWCNTKAHSANRLPANTEGYIEYTVESVNKQMFLGLTNSDNHSCFHQIQFSLHQQNKNFIVYENGSRVHTSHNALQVGDIMRVHRLGANIYYIRIRNGVTTTMFTHSSTTINLNDELFASVRLYYTGTTMSSVKASFDIPMDITANVTHIDLDNGIQGNIDITVTGPSSPYTYSWDNGANTEDLNNITQNRYKVTVTDIFNNVKTKNIDVNYLVKWRDLVGTNYNSTTNTVLNNSYNSWCNSRGLSKNKLSAGINGYIEYKISATNMQMFLGFTTTSTSTCFHTIKHAIHQQNSNFIIYENGSKKFTSPGALQTGDIVRVQIDRLANEAHYTITRNGIVTLSKTRVLLIGNNENTYADFRMYYTNTSMSNVSCSFTYSNSIKYAELYSKLDGGYYKVEDDKLRFHYEEQYQDLDGNLDYKITLTGENINFSLPAQAVTYGNNYYEIDLTSIQVPGYFILEVTNEKNEKQYLRFFYLGNPIIDPEIPCPGCSAQ